MRCFEYSILSLLLASLVVAVSSPQCQTIAPNQTVLDQVRTANTSTLSGFPFGLVYAAEGDFAFVSLSSSTKNKSSTLGVLNATAFPPELLHEIDLNDTRLDSSGVLGLALTKTGKYLFVSCGTGAYIVDTCKAIEGDSSSVVGILNGNQNVTGNQAIEITLTHDDSYAFVSQEYGKRGALDGNIDVFKLDYTVRDAVTSEHIGYINLGASVVGSTLSQDGRLLYVTSEGAETNYTSGGLAPANHGILSVLNVTTLITHPEKAQISNVTAGCEPVRQIVSSDGKYVWVSARASNRLLGFNASALIDDPSNALLASVQVGTEPVGLTFVFNETRIITADSDRFDIQGAHSGLTVVDVEAALAGSESAVGYIPTGLFPREFATRSNDMTLLVADYSSKQIQAVDLATAP